MAHILLASPESIVAVSTFMITAGGVFLSLSSLKCMIQGLHENHVRKELLKFGVCNSWSVGQLTKSEEFLQMTNGDDRASASVRNFLIYGFPIHPSDAIASPPVSADMKTYKSSFFTAESGTYVVKYKSEIKALASQRGDACNYALPGSLRYINSAFYGSSGLALLKLGSILSG